MMSGGGKPNRPKPTQARHRHFGKHDIEDDLWSRELRKKLHVRREPVEAVLRSATVDGVINAHKIGQLGLSEAEHLAALFAAYHR